jgi:6-phosphofructokinase 1
MNGYKGNKKVGIVFSGGPAPSANAVISSTCLNFLDKDIDVIGIFQGFEYLENFNSEDPHSFQENIHYEVLDAGISNIRNRRGVYLRTSRANPGKMIKTKDDLKNPVKNRKLQNILDGLEHLGVGFLVTIGGDDTLKTANYLHLMGLPVIHIPKTIDNDYFGIAWTFGYWSAIQYSKETLLNLKADSETSSSYFLVELMGRKAGWLTYSAGIAGEAVLMIASEDINEKELNLDQLADKIIDTILAREKIGKFHGVICVAESLAEKLPTPLKPTETDRHGNIIMSKVEVGRIIRDHTVKRFEKRAGKKKKIIYKQIGYETRSVTPISFDVVLGSMLGFGARKLYYKQLFGCMVSITDAFQVKAVPFTELIDEETLLAKLRVVPRESDFFELKEALSYIKN